MKILVVPEGFTKFQEDMPVVTRHNSHKSKIMVWRPSEKTRELIHSLGNLAPHKMVLKEVVTFFSWDDVESMLEKMRAKPAAFQVEDLRSPEITPPTTALVGRCAMAAPGDWD